MKANVCLRGEIWIFALCGLETESDLLFVGSSGTHSCMPGGAGFDGVAGFQNIETVIRIVRQQGFQRLNDVLFRPCLMLPADKRPAATTANQHAFAHQFRQRLAQRVARYAELYGQLALSGQLHARFQVFFINQRPHTIGNLV